MAADSPTVLLDNLGDFTLANFALVSRGGASIGVSSTACTRIDERRAAFIRYVNSDPTPWIYGVTGGIAGSRATLLTAGERDEQTRRPISAGAVLFGEAMPERVVRGAVFCRLANFIEGHSAVRAELVLAVAAMLVEPLPPLPRFGHGTAGETLLLSQLFGRLADSMTLEAKEAFALLNGAPVAAALLADSLLRAGPLLLEAIDAVAAAIDAFRAPPDACDPTLGALWQNPFAEHALALLASATRRRAGEAPARLPQAPVSYRVAPRLLARALRSYATLRSVAESSIRAVTDNPIVVNERGTLRVLSNGGFFDADASPVFDELAGLCADLVRLVEKLATRLAETADAASLSRTARARLRGLVSSLAGYAEDAASTASRTPLPGTEGGGTPQNDLISPVVQAWAKLMTSSGLLSTATAVLRAVAACIEGDDSVDVHALDQAVGARMNSAMEPPPELEPPSIRTGVNRWT
jgi:histidine ammonia-lyase